MARRADSNYSCRESFPSEFLAHHAPLCFVAGLAPPLQPQDARSNDPFVILQHALKKALVSRTRFPIWDNARGANADLHTIIVDKVSKSDTEEIFKSTMLILKSRCRTSASRRLKPDRFPPRPRILSSRVSRQLHLPRSHLLRPLPLHSTPPSHP